MIETEIAVVGGGIVGLAIARELIARYPGLKVTVLEKEDRVAVHQSGRNSGVIHSGIYYAPGSVKARLARAGCESMKAFCRGHGVPHRTTGKLIVALEEHELDGLGKLEERAHANGIEYSRLDSVAAREIEPSVSCLEALFVPAAGVVDYRVVCERLRDVIEASGGEIILRARVSGIGRNGGKVVLETSAGRCSARRLVNAAGLYSDRIASLDGIDVTARIIPFRGEYFRLRSPSSDLVKGLIYPVPDVRYPFLGVHLTRSVDGDVHAGPNAVLALAREGYVWRNVSIRDMCRILAFPGFWRFLSRHLGTAAGELGRSFSAEAFARSVRRLVPEVDPGDLSPAPAGVRAQALGPDGELVDDFLIEETELATHVLNAPSPAATSSLEIARVVCDRITV